MQSLVSWSLLVGFVLGFVANRAFHLLRVFWLERCRPLPDGRHRSKWDAVAVDPRWFAALVAVAFLGWSVFQTQDNATDNARIASDAKTFAAQVQKCQADLIASIIGSRKISADNDRLSQAERDLLAEGSRLSREWLGSLLLPPPDIARLTANDPERQKYTLDRTRTYFDQVGDVNRRIDAVHDEQQRNERERPALPDPQCGA